MPSQKLCFANNRSPFTNPKKHAIEGLQGHDENYLKAAACAKHFAVHSEPESVRHEFDAVTSEQDLRETYLPAFEACVKEAKVEAVMGRTTARTVFPAVGITGF